MLVNCHCHIFNIQSIYTEQVREIIAGRLNNAVKLRGPWGDLLADGLQGVLRRIHENNLEENPSEKSKGFLDTIFSKSMDAVTDQLLDQMEIFEKPEKTVIVPQMMDICPVYRGEDIPHWDTKNILPEKDRHDPDPYAEKLFVFQKQETMRQILRYPGRVLPFYAVNPNRRSANGADPLHYVELMETALETEGFAGVKLYPSLGYEMERLDRDGVLAYCDANQTPLLMHTNDGGFKFNNDTSLYCNPAYWETYLEKYQNLKICFGHFGGDDALEGKVQEQGKSTNIDLIYHARIKNLMERFESRVFADVSYHAAALGDSGHRYFANLNALFEDGKYADQILWGTDYPLILMDASEEDYTKKFRGGLVPKHFQLASDANARRFLGLDEKTPNVKRFLRFLRTQKNAGNAVYGQAREPAADWLPDDLK